MVAAHVPHHPDALCAELAARQHGVISVVQMREAGLGRGAVALRVRHRRLHRLHRGVYAWGHVRLGPWGRLWGAQLATGGVVSHQSAAWAWGLLPPPAMPVHVSVPTRQRSRTGIRVHETTTLRPEDFSALDGLPITTVARTIADLPVRPQARAIRQADHLGLLDHAELTALLTRHPGAARLERALERRTDAAPIRSPLEHRVLDVIAANDLPQPLVNHHLHGRERDFYWPEHRLVVETDGRHHERAWREDRRRDRDLLEHGIATVRFVDDDPDDEMARTLSALLLP